ncbi:MAG: undecaprenyl-phosphate glucose phosphotransferase, partial [Hyphomicrobiales bacterium]|nr:undecaprenyl-phosphate glucose phosphotransferase [Hyphomicrobiales bacterium]
MSAFATDHHPQPTPQEHGSSQVDHEPPGRQEALRRVALAESLAGLSPRPAYSAAVLTGLVRLFEFVAMAGAGFAAHAAYLGYDWSFEITVAIASISFVALAAFQALDVNNVSAFRDPAYAMLRVAGGWSFAFLLALAAIFFLKHDLAYSRVWLMSWFLTGFALLLTGRLVLSVVVRRMTARGSLERRTVIVGGGPTGEEVLRELAAQRHTDLRICGVFDDRADDRSPDVVIGFPKLGAVDDLVEFARRTRIDLIIFTLPITAEERILQMLRKLWVLPIDIRLA